MSKLPLSRFKVIDLTRVRAGPTCVRQLADWGARVIKVEAADGDGGLGGDRHGPDFQNLHRNKRAMTLNLKKPEGVAILKALVKDADVLVENYRPDVKFRLGIDYESLKPRQPPPRLCQHLGLRPDRPLSRAAGRRPDRPGHGRAHVGHRPARPGAGARRHPDRRSHRRHLHRDGHPDRPPRARGIGRGPVRRILAARGADRDARLPGGALDHGQGSSGPGRQQPSHQHPLGRVPHQGRPHQHRLGRRRHLRAHVRGDRPAAICRRTPISPRPRRGSRTATSSTPSSRK